MLCWITILGGYSGWGNTPVPKHGSTTSAWKIRFLRRICCGSSKTQINFAFVREKQSSHPELCSEVADGVTRFLLYAGGVCLFR